MGQMIVRSPVTVMGWIHCQEVPPNYLLETCVYILRTLMRLALVRWLHSLPLAPWYDVTDTAGGTSQSSYHSVEG